ncbi:MAG TPA: tRNA pseudouridine(38-40) synthase TruA [Firmicutes bacterium]|nr:tRNA pseudouridine(38-40) synthase TruA [Bacillota bacterium]
MRYLLTMRFCGENYHGWQVQHNAVTVQQTVQDALERLFGSRPGLTGCSRTDSGVHANMFCAHFDIDTDIPADKIPAALNAYLPEDIAVYACRTVDNDFHARYSASGKRYVYKILNSPYRNPFLTGRAYHVKQHLDLYSMQRAASGFIGRHDFSAFCSAGASVEDTVREVFGASVGQSGELIEFSVHADGFLYNMVRIMAGTLIDIGCGRLSSDAVSGIILSADRANAGFTAPPHGLYLDKVYYTEE